MAEITDLTASQSLVLAKIGQSELLKPFYFTGGTALAAFCLKHRLSEDLDLFSEQPFTSRELIDEITKISLAAGFTFTTKGGGLVVTFELTFADGSPLKVNFVHTSARRLQKGQIFEGVLVDSLVDIAVNKLLTVTQRTAVKDFVDLYFLLEKFTFWDLMEGVRKKYRVELDLSFTAADFMKVEQFNFMPKMVRSLDLDTLKIFFKDKARDLSAYIVTV